jgi:hypothetical protein
MRTRTLVTVRLLSCVALVCVALSCVASVARAEEPTSEARFAEGVTALDGGDYQRAIFAFEALADRGVVHPDVSFNRGIAYVARVRAGAGRPGDLGRAAAAFEEALVLRPGDPEAERALDVVRAEVTRRRSRRGQDAVDVRPTLDRMVVGLASEETWGLAAIAASVLLSLGLVLRSLKAGRGHVTGSVLAPTAGVALLVLAPLTWGARELRLTTRPGVVVIGEIHMTDDQGKTLESEPLPEGASVEIGEYRADRVHVRWGASQGWVPISSVRKLGP